MQPREGRFSIPLFMLLSFTISVYASLLLLSLGSGWSFPRILPDRIDFEPWRHFWADHDGLSQAAVQSLVRSVIVCLLSTTAGLIAARSIRQMRSGWGLLIAYLPFVLSPVIVGVCLFDFVIRIGLASTFTGVVIVQSLFATAFATVFFSEMWNPQIDKFEQLVKTLGGGSIAIWKHAILPRVQGLVVVCLIETALFSWLDYGIISMIGGGREKSLTMMLFAYIREASVNQAAQSSLMLLAPALAGLVVMSGLYVWSTRRSLPAERFFAHEGERQ